MTDVKEVFHSEEPANYGALWNLFSSLPWFHVPHYYFKIRAEQISLTSIWQVPAAKKPTTCWAVNGSEGKYSSDLRR